MQRATTIKQNHHDAKDYDVVASDHEHDDDGDNYYNDAQAYETRLIFIIRGDKPHSHVGVVFMHNICQLRGHTLELLEENLAIFVVNMIST